MSDDVSNETLGKAIRAVADAGRSLPRATAARVLTLELLRVLYAMPMAARAEAFEFVSEEFQEMAKDWQRSIQQRGGARLQ